MQTRQQNQEPDDSGLEAPPRLVAALKALPQEKVFVPPLVDEAVYRAAHRHLGKAERRGLPWGGWFRWVLPATAVGVVCVLAVVWSGKITRTAAPQFAAQDLNHDGKVDILDVMILARRVETVTAANEPRSIGKTASARDVATLAAQVVKLDGARGDNLSSPPQTGGRS